MGFPGYYPYWLKRMSIYAEDHYIVYNKKKKLKPDKNIVPKAFLPAINITLALLPDLSSSSSGPFSFHFQLDGIPSSNSSVFCGPAFVAHSLVNYLLENRFTYTYLTKTC